MHPKNYYFITILLISFSLFSQTHSGDLLVGLHNINEAHNSIFTSITGTIEIGSLLYNESNKKVYVYTGAVTGWVAIDSNDGDAWGVTGEDITSDIGRTGKVGIGILTPSKKLDINGETRIRTLTAGAGTDDIVVADTDGVLKKIPQASIATANEPWFGTDDDMGATLNTENIYTKGEVTIGSSNYPSTDANLTIAMADNGLDGLDIRNTTTTSSERLAQLINNADTGVSLYIRHDNAANPQGAIRIDGAKPEIEFVETDQTGNNGKWEIQANGGDFGINSRVIGDTAFEKYLYLNGPLSDGGQLVLNAQTNSATRDLFKISNAVSSAGAAPGFAWENTAGSLTTARLSSAGGSGFNNSNFRIQVADNTKTLQERLRVDVDGDVGIGTTDPLNKLHVEGDARITSLTTGASSDDIVVADGDGVLKKIPQASVATANEPWFGTDDNAGATDNTEDIYSMGKVGIGETNPDSKLQVNYGTLADLNLNDIRQTTALTLSGSDPGTTSDSKGVSLVMRPIKGRGTVSSITTLNDGTNKEGNSNMLFMTGQGGYPSVMKEHMRILGGTGNVLIGGETQVGGATPKLSVQNNVNNLTTANITPIEILQLSRGGTTGNKWGANAQFKLGSYLSHAFSRSSLEIALTNVNSESTYNTIMTLNGSGNVGIGTTAPTKTLDIDGEARIRTIPAGNTSDEYLTVDTNGNVRKVGVSPLGAVNKSYIQTYKTSRTFGSGNATVLNLFPQVTIQANKKVKLELYVPTRDNTNSWGGLYVNVNANVNGTWYNLGNTGYDGGVMHSSATSIHALNHEMLLDFIDNLGLPTTASYTLQIELTARSYNGTTTVNGSHDINRTANNLGARGALQTWASDQNYAHVIITEMDK